MFLKVCIISIVIIVEDLAAVDAYVRRGEYPSGGEKANLRRKCRNNFKLEEEVLYYKKASDESDWKICS